MKAYKKTGTQKRISTNGGDLGFAISQGILTPDPNGLSLGGKKLTHKVENYVSARFSLY
ncbi:hypothetical protein GCM10010912_20850 [Paenibacillus albidus]|uniref:Uncharacterized protein n=1 Tax=Paenibacillus albidus TaxID=2041023 RepID=A0A917C8A7_9BACL|nr:hypothetical protein GCM10010912_20850 [Paenibacillus albidus]